MENYSLTNALSSFKEHFRGYEDCYTIIGGTACMLLMEDAGLEFRATRDIDMILVLEEKKEEFSKIFWNYIHEGNYICGWKNNVGHYYRFQSETAGYPKQIELFSRRNDFKPDQRIIPVSISEDVSSLSAIALDEDFYRFMLNGRTLINGVCILLPEYIIPFKMLAWLNNKKDKENGIFVRSRDITKHKNDIFRLYNLLTVNTKIKTEGNVRKTIETFFEEIFKEIENCESEKELTEKCRNLKEIYIE